MVSDEKKGMYYKKHENYKLPIVVMTSLVSSKLKTTDDFQSFSDKSKTSVLYCGKLKR